MSFDYGTAIHEAAHAVTGVEQGFRIYDVYIYQDGSGQTSFGKVNLRDASSVRAFARSILAGPVAELIYKGSEVTQDELADLDGASADIAKVGALAQQFDLHGVIDETVTMVEASFDSIIKVADKLMTDQHVEDTELGELV
jgi:hypothetical protein